MLIIKGIIIFFLIIYLLLKLANSALSNNDNKKQEETESNCEIENRLMFLAEISVTVLLILFTLKI